MENFKFYAPTKVYFGKNEEKNVGKILKGYHPKKVLIHYGGNSAIKSGLLDRVKKALEEENIAYCLCGGVVANPLLSKVNEGIELCKKKKWTLSWLLVEAVFWIQVKVLRMVFIMKAMSGIIMQERKR